ncbi:hypothetical protein [Legionella londiniensis]|uniref:Uncharacterized protein n=1 Tax=Legionella londiniensis TaxID=45068 RepID=A0A0W0VHE0_9GAMM|nr:hypothetical protein [Legionella londiniensis]KTD19556.1 hypothetical protein Llon_2136 [Legionella londiniensis]STX92222.1 Uncharacterised protein [Legionella londiniensis]
MSEKQQRTASQTREKMQQRYGDGLPHKHDKCHHAYRQHYRTHPVEPNKQKKNNEINQPTGIVRALNLRKVRKRLDKGRFH